MDLASEHIENCLIVTVNEHRIDAAVAVEFKDAMRAMLQDPPERVVLDMAAVDSIDSSGLGSIVAVMKQLGVDRRLELASLSDKVRTVFRLTRMDSVMTIHEARDDALASYAS